MADPLWNDPRKQNRPDGLTHYMQACSRLTGELEQERTSHAATRSRLAEVEQRNRLLEEAVGKVREWASDVLKRNVLDREDALESRNADDAWGSGFDSAMRDAAQRLLSLLPTPTPDCPAYDQERGCMCREPEEDCPVQDEEVQP